VISVFGQLTWSITDRWYLTAGGRISSEKKKASRTIMISTIDGEPLPPPTAPYTHGLYAALFNITDHDIEGDRKTTRFMPSVDIQYDVSDNSMVYFSISSGVKSGGYDARSNNAPDNGGSFEFDDEDATSYELGAKMLFNGGATELNFAVFYMNYNDLQVSSFDGVLGFNVGNAAKATTQGFELDSRWLVTDHLLLSGSIAFTDFEYKEYYGECYFGQIPDAPDGINCDYKGQTNVLTPDYSGILSADYNAPLGSSLQWGWTIDAIFSGKYFTSSNLDPLQEQSSYYKLNARLSIAGESNRWELALVGKNLTNEDIMTLSGDVPLAGGSFGAPGFSAFYEQPRSIALQATFRY
jgi:outer membrane receptor protein involved in Fe transport